MQTFLPSRLRRRERIFIVSVSAAMVAIAVGVLRVFNPATAWFFPPCPFRALTGFLCPGCGTLRALHQFLNGHFVAGFRLNPLMMLLLPCVGYSAASSALEMAGAPALPRVFLRPIYIWALLAVIIAFWILRNVPYFTMLRGG